MMPFLVTGCWTAPDDCLEELFLIKNRLGLKFTSGGLGRMGFAFAGKLRSTAHGFRDSRDLCVGDGANSNDDQRIGNHHAAPKGFLSHTLSCVA